MNRNKTGGCSSNPTTLAQSPSGECFKQENTNVPLGELQRQDYTQVFVTNNKAMQQTQGWDLHCFVRHARKIAVEQLDNALEKDSAWQAAFEQSGLARTTGLPEYAA